MFLSEMLNEDDDDDDDKEWHQTSCLNYICPPKALESLFALLPQRLY
jgi:hypothetical protein